MNDTSAAMRAFKDLHLKAKELEKIFQSERNDFINQFEQVDRKMKDYEWFLNKAYTMISNMDELKVKMGEMHSVLADIDYQIIVDNDLSEEDLKEDGNSCDEEEIVDNTDDVSSICEDAVGDSYDNKSIGTEQSFQTIETDSSQPEPEPEPVIESEPIRSAIKQKKSNRYPSKPKPKNVNVAPANTQKAEPEMKNNAPQRSYANAHKSHNISQPFQPRRPGCGMRSSFTGEKYTSAATSKKNSRGPKKSRVTKKSGYKYGGTGFKVFTGYNNQCRPIYGATTLLCRDTASMSEDELMDYLVTNGKFTPSQIEKISFSRWNAFITVRASLQSIKNKLQNMNGYTETVSIFERDSRRNYDENAVTNVLFVNNFDIVNKQMHKRFTNLFLNFGVLAEDIRMGIDRNRDPFAIVHFKHVNDARRCVEGDYVMFGGKTLSINYSRNINKKM